MHLPPPHPAPRPRLPRAFTLVELLVSMTVLTLLVVAVGQIVGGASAVATGNRQRLDADEQARLVFDRMGLDFSRMLKRQDVDYLFAPQTGNDKFFFYSEAPAYFDGSAANTGATAQSPLALVGYRIDSSVPAKPTLSRLGKGLTWDETGGATPGAIVFLTPSATPSVNATPSPDVNSTLAGHWPTTLGTSPNYSGTDASYHVIAEQVCRLEICFLLKPLAITATTAAMPAAYSVTPYRVGVPAHGAVNGMQDVRAVVVSLAVLDSATRQITPDLSRMSTALADITTGNLTTTPPTLPAKIWQDEIDQRKLAADAQIPPAAAAQVRVYQRHFYLDTN